MIVAAGLAAALGWLGWRAPAGAAQAPDSASAAANEFLQPGQEWHDTLRDGTPGPTLIFVPGGSFWMGTGDGGRASERPRHRVTIARALAVAQTETSVAEFRRFNYEHVYLRPASRAQGDAVIALLRALVEHYADRPNLLPDGHDVDAGSEEALRVAVGYVGGMTDRFACRQALALLGWDRAKLPVGIDI